MVGPAYAKRLTKLGILTVTDLLTHFPTRYEDFSLISVIDKLQAGETVTVCATVNSIKNIYTKNHKKIQQAIVSDETGSMEIIWFNQMFLTRTILKGEKYNFSGKIEESNGKIILISPQYEKIRILNQVEDDESFAPTIHTGKLIPVYPETYGVSSKWLRSRIAPLLKECKSELFEYLPDSILTKNELMSYKNAIEQIHYPTNKKDSEKARERLAFDELLLIQLASLKRKEQWNKEKVGHRFDVENCPPTGGLKIENFIASLPFQLTSAQNHALNEILHDLESDKPMNRLLEGDVGSGKTVVAAISMYVSYLNGYQSVLMAPTEILAQQHYETIKKLLNNFGVSVGLVTGNNVTKQPACRQAGQCNNVLVGTHALLSDKNKDLFQNVGLVVIDEQHRFGVEQRAKLKSRGVNPHLLTMTATPIPRTVALTLYAELDLSVLNEMPLGRQKIKTWVVPNKKREAAYQWIKKQIKENQTQAFIICPLIEESENLKTVKAATQEYDFLQKKVFPNLRLGLLHGRLKPKEKDQVLQDFRNQKLNILVTTPVVEVGIDIPNATIMMIEAADRFGLASLHQLRGRIGRNNQQAYCLLFSESKNISRLKALETIHVGSELAQLDLKNRGAGEIYGTAQHGSLNLKVADFSNLTLINKTHQIAQELIEKLDQFPLLKEKLERYTIKNVGNN